jgi:hypothetical protein
MLIGLVVWTLFKGEEGQGIKGPTRMLNFSPTGNTTEILRPYIFFLFIFMVSGFLALVYEVAWSRALILVFGTSIYAFATILTTYLIGIALGSLLMTAGLNKIRREALLFLGFASRGLRFLHGVEEPGLLELGLGGGDPVEDDDGVGGSSASFGLGADVEELADSFPALLRAVGARGIAHGVEELGPGLLGGDAGDVEDVPVGQPGFRGVGGAVRADDAGQARLDLELAQPVRRGLEKNLGDFEQRSLAAGQQFLMDRDATKGRGRTVAPGGRPHPYRKTSCR